jgi:uncharacterized membrane protein
MGMADEELDRGGWHGHPIRPLVRFSAIGEAWEFVKQSWGVWVVTILIVLIGFSVLNGILASVFRIEPLREFGAFRFPLRTGGDWLRAILNTIVSGFFLGGMVRMACQQVRGFPVRVDTLFSVVDVLPELLLGSVLYGLASLIGFACLLLPGFILQGVLMFTLPLIVDGRLPATRSMAESWRVLKGQWLSATVFHLVLWAISGIGACFCGVGLLFTAPIYSLGIAILYRDFFLSKGFMKPSPYTRY